MTQLMSEDIGCLAVSLSKAQSEIQNVNKDKNGYNYKYASLSNCLDAIRVPLANNSLAISQVICGESLVTLLIHESGQWLKSEFTLTSVATKSMNDMQAYGSGITYARRYALSAIIGLAQEDDDAQSVKYDHTHQKDHKKEEKSEMVKVKDMVDQIRILCEESQVDMINFAKYFKIESKNPKSLENSIRDFPKLLDEFRENDRR